MDVRMNALLEEANSRLAEDWEAPGSILEQYLSGIAEILSREMDMTEEDAAALVRDNVVDLINHERLAGLPEDADTEGQQEWVEAAHELGIMGYMLKAAQG